MARGKKSKAEDLLAIAQLAEEQDEVAPPSHEPHVEVVEAAWKPDLNPTQELMFNDPAKFILAHSEKGSGKSVGLLHKLVRHCYENKDAFALIGSPSVRTGADGAGYDLSSLILPAWKDGNRAPNFLRTEAGLVPNPNRGELMDEGIGLEFQDWKAEFDTKDRVAWIANRHGGWSKVKLISIPYPEFIQPRIKGPAPSFIYFDELTDCATDDYFKYPAAQLGRRRNIEGPQQYTASCNPKGPSHWVYKTFFETCVDPQTGERDKDFSVYHVPVAENIHRLPTGYVDGLQKILRGDPIAVRRLINGEWIEMPSGEALFKEYYSEERHVIGDPLTGTGLAPHPSFPVMVGYDIGPAYTAAVFLQAVPTAKGSIWIVFDEHAVLGKKVHYESFAREVVRMMDHWNELAGRELAWAHIADSSAMDQWRGSGSFDSLDFQKFSNNRIRMKGCPKGPGSIEARVRSVTAELMSDSLYVSAHCNEVRQMLLHLEGEKDKINPETTTGKPKKTARGHIHVFDAMSYPILNFNIGGGMIIDYREAMIQFIRCG